MVSAFKVVSHRVDWLTLAYRVELDDEFLELLQERAAVARTHGRAALEWEAHPGRVKASKRYDQVGYEWRKKFSFQTTTKIVGELAWSRAAKSYNLRHEPYYRLHIDLAAPGATRFVDDLTGEIVEEPGWNVEISWYAETLAIWPLERVLAETTAIAHAIGKVKEQRLRRIDLCADVANWEIQPTDIDRIVKRPRCIKDSTSDATEIDELGRASRSRPKPGELAGSTSHETGKPGERKVCGISVGRGGALMMRMYNKVLELGYDSTGRKRALEYERWCEGGWDGASPVTRVEFQIRGVAIRELGLLDPECVREMYVADPDTGRKLFLQLGHSDRPDNIDLVYRLPWIWTTMLSWARLVIPGEKGTPTTRLANDPRWALLHDLKFGEVYGRPIRRFRKRGAASEAMALGVALSQAAATRELPNVKQWSESTYQYDAETAESVLRARVARLKADEAERIIKWLLAKCGEPVRANVHLATRARAAAARFAPWKGDVDDESFELEWDDDPGLGEASTEAERRAAELCPPPWWLD